MVLPLVGSAGTATRLVNTTRSSLSSWCTPTSTVLWAMRADTAVSVESCKRLAELALPQPVLLTGSSDNVIRRCTLAMLCFEMLHQ